MGLGPHFECRALIQFGLYGSSMTTKGCQKDVTAAKLASSRLCAKLCCQERKNRFLSVSIEECRSIGAGQLETKLCDAETGVVTCQGQLGCSRGHHADTAVELLLLTRLCVRVELILQNCMKIDKSCPT